jgi:hypothetical protein
VTAPKRKRRSAKTPTRKDADKLSSKKGDPIDESRIRAAVRLAIVEDLLRRGPLPTKPGTIDLSEFDKQGGLRGQIQQALLQSVAAVWVKRPQVPVGEKGIEAQIPAIKASFGLHARGGLSGPVSLLMIELYSAIKASRQPGTPPGDVERSSKPPVDARDGAYWVNRILAHGANALLQAAATLVVEADLELLPNNTLSTIGDLVSVAIRRALLLQQLEATDWNLAHTADKLRLGSTPNVLREIKRLDLSAEYERAKLQGRITRSGHRVRATEPSDLDAAPAIATKKPTKA